MSIKFSPAILGPKMAAPILCVPGIFGFFLQEKTSMPIKFLVLGGGVFGLWGAGGGYLGLGARGLF